MHVFQAEKCDVFCRERDGTEKVKEAFYQILRIKNPRSKSSLIAVLIENEAGKHMHQFLRAEEVSLIFLLKKYILLM
jgi:hypothetical protein